jgi:hypothetical protein
MQLSAKGQRVDPSDLKGLETTLIVLNLVVVAASLLAAIGIAAAYASPEQKQLYYGDQAHFGPGPGPFPGGTPPYGGGPSPGGTPPYGGGPSPGGTPPYGGPGDQFRQG